MALFAHDPAAIRNTFFALFVVSSLAANVLKLPWVGRALRQQGRRPIAALATIVVIECAVFYVAFWPMMEAIGGPSLVVSGLLVIALIDGLLNGLLLPRIGCFLRALCPLALPLCTFVVTSVVLLIALLFRTPP